MCLCTLWPVTETFWPKTISLVGYRTELKGSFPTPSLKTLGLFVSELCCGQTDRITDTDEHCTLTTVIGARNKEYIYMLTTAKTGTSKWRKQQYIKWWLSKLTVTVNTHHNLPNTLSVSASAKTTELYFSTLIHQNFDKYHIKQKSSIRNVC